MAFKKGQSGNPAGKPKGTYSKPRLADNISKKDLKEITAKAIAMAKAGNDQMIKLVIEQSYGKAPQAIDMTSGGAPIMIKIDS